MNKHKTVEELEEIYDLIAKFKEFINSGDQFEAMGAEMNLRDAIEKAYDDGIISENMHNDYLQLLDGYERDELPERLEEKTNENINIVEQADDKIAKSLDLGERADENVEHNVDSKTDLQYIKDVMNQYWHERDDKEGVLSAVDKFTEIGDAIKKSLEEKKISRMTAAELMEPLREIKDNMCDINRENDALDRFDEILDKKLAREDERDSQNQQQDQQYNNTGGVLGKALNILAKRLERTEPKTNAKTDAVAEEHDGQQKKDAQNKSPLSPEQIEQFESLKEEFLRRYHRAQVYHRNFQSKDWPVSAPFWENTVGAMEPLANMFKGLDLKEVTDTKQLEDLARQWSTTMAGMAQVYNWLDNQRADDGTKYTDYLALDDVWDNMDRLDDVAGRFFAELGLNQQQGKETPKKEYVKPETKVEQKQPEPKQPQEEIKTAPVPETPHDTVDGKKQEKKDVAQEPEDVMKREDKVQDSKKRRSVEEVMQEKMDAQNRDRALDLLRDKIDNLGLITTNDMSSDRRFDMSVAEFQLLLDEAEKNHIPQELAETLRHMNRYAYGDEQSYVNDLRREVDKYYNRLEERKPNQEKEDGKKQEKKDVAQESEDALKREDKVQEEVVSQEKPQEKQNTNEAAIARLRQIVDMFDRQNSDESFKKMMFALKEVADSKMVPDEMVDAYRAIFENVKKHGNTERGIFDLSTELYNQIDELQNPEDYRVASEENTPKKPEKVMTHEDVAQKESDLKPKSDKEIEQQTEVREDMMVRKDARPGNVDEKDKKQQVQHRIDNFTNGNQKVLDMDNKRENSKKELNQAALAAYRRRVLEGRGTSNV